MNETAPPKRKERILFTQPTKNVATAHIVFGSFMHFVILHLSFINVTKYFMLNKSFC